MAVSVGEDRWHGMICLITGLLDGVGYFFWRYFVHTIKMFLRAFRISQFAAGPASESVHADDPGEWFQFFRKVWIHTKLRNGIAPYADHWFFQGGGNMHHPGIVADNLYGLPYN